MKPRTTGRESGFSLVELAIGLVIVATLLTSLLVPLATQVEQRRTVLTQRLLDEVKDALMTFAVANGRLPCPATDVSNGIESPVGGGICLAPGAGVADGFVPAVTLGLAPLDNQGYLLDAFGDTDRNRLRYAVSRAEVAAGVPVLTTANGMRGATMPSLAGAGAPRFLTVCAAASTDPNACSAGILPLADGNAMVVIYSLGKNGVIPVADRGTTAYRERSPEEIENMDADGVFASRTPYITPTVEHDDMLVWISPSVLLTRMIMGGALP